MREARGQDTMTEPQAALDVRPQKMEVAAAWLPPGARVSLHGRLLPSPDLDFGRYAEIGWDAVSGGRVLMVHGTWQALRNGRDVDSRPVWAEAAEILRRAAREGSGPCAVYVVIRERPGYGPPALTAGRVRRETTVQAGAAGEDRQ